MYCRVPPPSPLGEQAGSDALSSGEEVAMASEGRGVEGVAGCHQPANLSQQQWQRFQKLRTRRAEVCGKGSAQRVNSMRKNALEQVSRELSEQDKRVLAEEGVHLPHRARRKRHSDASMGASARATPSSSISGPEQACSTTSSPPDASNWQQLKKYLDPNPQLTSHKEQATSQKSGLEKALDRALQEGEHEKAAVVSNEMATREFAAKVATAFDCVEFVKRQKLEKKKKGKKLKWSFEQKKRWETKGNM